MDENLTMKDFDDDINNSFKKLIEGDIVKATVISVSESEVTVDLNYYTEGVIMLEELSNNPQFSIKADISVGDVVSAMVLSEDVNSGRIILSKKKADDVIAWDVLKEAFNNKKTFNVKISQTTKSGVITYLEGIRAFIPASQLSLSYVEDLETWVGKTITARIITVETASKKLVLSAKEVEKDKADTDKAFKIANLQKGTVLTGTIETVMPYGVFVDIGDGLSGLVHISQICDHHIKSPHEIVKEGQEVKVKVINVKDGKVSLSIKAVSDNNDLSETTDKNVSTEYISNETASTSLASLLSNIKLN